MLCLRHSAVSQVPTPPLADKPSSALRLPIGETHDLTVICAEEINAKLGPQEKSSQDAEEAGPIHSSSIEAYDM